MSNAAIIIIAVVVIVVLAAIVLVTAARRADVRGAGALSRETRRRDKDARSTFPQRRPVAPSSAPSASPWHRSGRGQADDARGVGSTGRRCDRCQPAHVPEPGHRVAHRCRSHDVRRGRLRRLPVADRQGRLRRQDQRRQDRRRHRQHPVQRRLLLQRHGTFVGHPVPGRRTAEGQGRGQLQAAARRHVERHRGAVPEVPAPRLPRPAMRQQPVVRVPVSRLAVQPRR